MIYGIGTDIVAVSRLQAMWLRHGERALSRLLAPGEIDDFQRSAHPGRFLAKRFAAKEAFAKALGTGLRPPATLNAIGVTHDSSGRPVFALTESLDAVLHKEGITRCHLSLSDEAEYAVAYVILEQP